MSERFEVRKYGHAVPVARGTCENCGRPVRYNLAASIVIHVGGGEPNDCREPWPAANIEAAEIDGEPSEGAGTSASTNEASTPRSVESVPRVDGSDASATPAGAAISDEMVEIQARAVYALDTADTLLPEWDRSHEKVREVYREEAQKHLTALVASGYRREVDVLRGAAPGLIDRAAAAARRMAGADSLSASIMASIVRSALWQALGCTCSDHSDVGAVYIEDLTCPMHGSIPATALERAQPLLAAGSEVESLEPVESSEGQERSEGSAAIWVDQSTRMAGDRFVCGDCGDLWPVGALGPPFEHDRCRKCGGLITAVWDVTEPSRG